MPRLSSAGAERLEAANAALLAPVQPADWADTVIAAFRALLKGEHAAVVIGRGDNLQFFGDARALALLRHTHERSGTRPGPIFQRGFWLHSGPHHAGVDRRPHDAVGVCEQIDGEGSFVGACCTFAQPLPPETSRARLRLLKAVRPALAASARLQLVRLHESTELAAMLEVVGDAAALVSQQGEIVQVSSELRRLLEIEGAGPNIRAAVSALAAGSTCLTTGPQAPEGNRCCSELEVASGRFSLRCCPMPGDPALGRRLILVTLHAQRPADLPSASDLAKQFGLTRRECDVAFQLHTGKSNAEVAESLGISAFTARHHTERVLTKLGVRTRAAVHGALRELAIAVANGAQLPTRDLGGRHRTRNAGRRRLKVVDTLSAAPTTPSRRPERLPDDAPRRWHYDPTIGDSAAPIAPRAD